MPLRAYIEEVSVYHWFTPEHLSLKPEHMFIASERENNEKCCVAIVDPLDREREREKGGESNLTLKHIVMRSNFIYWAPKCIYSLHSLW